MTWIPNALTAFRFLLLPVLVALMAQAGSSTQLRTPARLAVLAAFLVMAASDWLDGYLARRLNVITRWGSTADAIADRLALLVPLLYVALVEPTAFSDVPLWVPLWLVALDLLTGTAWLLARWRRGAGRPISHHLAGRAGVWILFTLVLGVLAGLPALFVMPLAIVGLSLASVSSLLYIRGWFGSQ